MKNFLFICAAFFLLACNKTETKSGFTIKGKIKNLSANNIQLQELTGKGLIFIDSTTVAPDGTFEFTGNVTEPTFCVIQMPLGATVLLVDSTAEINLNIDANVPEQFVVNGSAETEKLKQLLEVNTKYMLLVKGIETRMQQYAETVPPIEVQNQVRQEYDSLMKGRETEMQAIAGQMENSLVPYFATNFLLPQADFGFLKSVDDKLYAQFAKSKYAQDLHSRITTLSKTAIGSTAPDVVLQDPYGKTIALSSLRGKIVLVDFWASWCKPCREENPNVVAAYNRFKDKGFEVFSVSLDDNKEAWVKAINDDRLLWTHVSDLAKWNSTVVSQYNIEGIPFTVLLDKEGKIIAKNLRGSALTDKLKELMP